MLSNILTSPLFWAALIALLILTLIVLLRRRPHGFVEIIVGGRPMRIPRDQYAEIVWNNRTIPLTHAIYQELLNYLEPEQRRLVARVQQARRLGRPISPIEEQNADAFLASTIREAIFHKPGYAAWFVER